MTTKTKVSRHFKYKEDLYMIIPHRSKYTSNKTVKMKSKAKIPVKTTPKRNN